MGPVVELAVTECPGPGSVILADVSQGWLPLLASLETLLDRGEPLVSA